MPEQTTTRLKEEGNVLFFQSIFDEVLVKYTAAIELDGSNTKLWANRNACHLWTKRCLDTVGDSRKLHRVTTVAGSKLHGKYPPCLGSHLISRVPSQEIEVCGENFPFERLSTKGFPLLCVYAAELDPTYYKAWAGLATASDGFQHLVDGIIREDHVFHLEKEALWISAYNRLGMFERERHDPWLAAGPVHLKQNEYYGRCLEVVEWRRELWKDVPASVRRECYSINREDIKLAEKLSEEADVLLESLRTDPAPGDNAESGFKLSFYDFCRGSAYACKAFFHSDLARRGSSVEQNFRLAEEYYLQAAEAYPVDDEHHCKYLNSALKNLFYRPGVTVRRALDIMARFWVSVKEPKKIWNQHPSRMRPERDQSNGIVMYRENVLRREDLQIIAMEARKNYVVRAVRVQNWVLL
ncbi:hypothetical protein EDD18DRAFT_1101930 [Armillaria luteobubalina]|uniref:Uncharacterized protein n=1 Tax=Armillaria luteobubalina TaxID=153913 RepID=A0AA39QDN4_9AGAR|nr:hypothetical protein EDD18DRAFT_1101930 [Armillaria luteobubalina]